ncbi:solute carrier family 40 member [Anaeramoeba flamelloides]|uniref:Solute carrier family 40 member n=1 Tax=Anaeramoeba flamelloides TaxID=1746091 RepID=A0ABQ8Z589_9EUKA|nr:solute carrier family 40 member [Anaeramoeba flamelloides]
MPIVLMEIFIDTLLPSALFALVTSLLPVIGMLTLSKKVDTTDRYKFVRNALSIQNIGVIASVGVVIYIWYLDRKSLWKSSIFWVLFIFLLIVSSIGVLCSALQNISITKDWVVVICQGSSDLLANLNSVLRRIDLTNAVISPIAFSIIIEYSTILAGLLFIGIWNALSFFPELKILKWIYQFIPELRNKKSSKKEKNTNYKDEDYTTDNDDDSDGFEKKQLTKDQIDSDSDLSNKSQNSSGNENDEKENQKKKKQRKGLHLFSHHRVFYASLSFAMLFFTVLDFSVLYVSFLVYKDLPFAVIGIGRGLNALFGIIGTWIAPKLLSRFGIKRTGLIATILQLLFISSGTFLFFVFDQSIYWYLAGVIISRIFLWCTDLVNTQIMQTLVEEDNRGVINGMQSAICGVSTMASYVVCLFYSDPKDFDMLSYFSLATVVLSLIFYLVFMKKCEISEEEENFKKKNPPVKGNDKKLINENNQDSGTGSDLDNDKILSSIDSNLDLYSDSDSKMSSQEEKL